MQEYGQAYGGIGIGQQEARHRMVMLAMARAKYNQKMKEEAEKAEQLMKAEEHAANQQGVSSVWGSIGQSALTGAGIGAMTGNPGGIAAGAIIGAGAGLLLGGAAEAKNRRTLAKVEGKKDPGWGGAIKDTFVRAPTLNEFGRLAGAAGGIGAMQAGRVRDDQAQAKAMQDQGLADWRMREAFADKTGRYGAQPSAPMTGTFDSTPTLYDAYGARKKQTPSMYEEDPGF